MAQLTVKELLKFCQQEVTKGNGDKHIVFADDNEANGYHGMFYAFSEYNNAYKNETCDSQYADEKDTIILG